MLLKHFDNTLIKGLIVLTVIYVWVSRWSSFLKKADDAGNDCNLGNTRLAGSTGCMLQFFLTESELPDRTGYVGAVQGQQPEGLISAYR